MKPPPLKDAKSPDQTADDGWAWMSGKNPTWFNTLADWSADEMRMSFARVKENGPTKECDVLWGCTEDVRWAVRFHDCHLYTACEEHAQLLASELMSAISQLGFFVCSDCGTIFFMQAEAVRFWRI